VRQRWTWLTFLYTNSSQAGQWIRATSSARVQEAPLHTLALPPGALQVSGGLLDLRWYADHQTKRDGADISAACRSFGNFGIANLISTLPCCKSRTFPCFKSAFVFVGHLPDICGSSPDRQHVPGSGSLRQLGQSSAAPPKSQRLPPSPMPALHQSLADPCVFAA
jgi:hypothetical protein